MQHLQDKAKPCETVYFIFGRGLFKTLSNISNKAFFENS